MALRTLGSAGVLYVSQISAFRLGSCASFGPCLFAGKRAKMTVGVRTCLGASPRLSFAGSGNYLRSELLPMAPVGLGPTSPRSGKQALCPVEIRATKTHFTIVIGFGGGSWGKPSPSCSMWTLLSFLFHFTGSFRRFKVVWMGTVD